MNHVTRISPLFSVISSIWDFVLHFGFRQTSVNDSLSGILSTFLPLDTPFEISAILTLAALWICIYLIYIHNNPKCLTNAKMADISNVVSIIYYYFYAYKNNIIYLLYICLKRKAQLLFIQLLLCLKGSMSKNGIHSVYCAHSAASVNRYS